MTGFCWFSHVKYDSYKRSRLKQMGKSKYKTAIDCIGLVRFALFLFQFLNVPNKECSWLKP